MSHSRLSSPAVTRTIRYLCAGITVGTIVNGLRLRQRATALHAIDSLPDSVGLVSDDDYELLLASGASMEPDSWRDAVAYARLHGLDVLDLVPERLATEQALDGLRQVDPNTLRTNRLATGRGMSVAIVVSRDALARAGGLPEADLEPADLARLLVELKRCAPTTTDLAVIAGLHVAPERLGERRRLLGAVFGPAGELGALLPLATIAIGIAGVLLTPLFGIAALVAHCLQPIIALRGTTVQPRDGRLALAGLRPLRTLGRSVGSLGTTAAQHEADEADQIAVERMSRQAYTELLSDGVERFFEPRTSTCPFCECDGALTTHVRCRDELQGKPGTFNLDRCELCGHIFQNPRLSMAGLDFYYRDFYDGVGESDLEFVFASTDVPYRRRAEMVRKACDIDEPKRWLDVGAGHGHFCLVAQAEFPDTRFDGLDLSDSIMSAERRGWIEQAHHGLFPELADHLVGRYDVVSMHHYLEHTREPLDELDAAATVLSPGGRLLIEVPDPECRLGRWLGRWWGPWFQPQHQQFLSVRNLTSALIERGFTVVSIERSEAHQPVEAAFGLWIYLNHLAPVVGRPWQTGRQPWGRLRRGVVFTLGAPFLAAALVLDRLAMPVLRRVPGGPNAYRVLAALD